MWEGIRTERSPVRTSARQVLVAGVSCAITFAIGSAFGTQVG